MQMFVNILVRDGLIQILAQLVRILKFTYSKEII